MPQGGPNQDFNASKPAAFVNPMTGASSVPPPPTPLQLLAAQDAATKAAGSSIPDAYWVSGHYNPMSETTTPGYWGDPKLSGGFSDVFTNILQSPVTKMLENVALIATGQAWAIPLLNGANTLSETGDMNKAVETMGKTYIASQAGQAAFGGNGSVEPPTTTTPEVPGDFASTAGSLPGPSLAPTITPDIVPAAAVIPEGISSIAPAALTASSAPGSELAASTATVAPTAANFALADLAPTFEFAGTPTFEATSLDFVGPPMPQGLPSLDFVGPPMPEGLSSLASTITPDIVPAAAAIPEGIVSIPEVATVPEVVAPEGIASIPQTITPDIVPALPEVLTTATATPTVANPVPTDLSPTFEFTGTPAFEATSPDFVGPPMPEGLPSLSPSVTQEIVPAAAVDSEGVASIAPTATPDIVPSSIAPIGVAAPSAPEGIASLNEMIASGTFTPGSAGAAGAVGTEFTPAELSAASGTLPAATSTNEMIASGMSPGSAGAQGATSGALTPAELASASGVLPAATSINEMVASGTSPGSAGAQGAVSQNLTDAQLATAYGVSDANTSGIPDLLSKLKNALLKPGSSTGSTSPAGSTIGTLGLAALIASMNKNKGTDDSYKGTIPKFTASRTRNTMPANYRPGQGGINYFSPMTYTPAASGGLMNFAEGGQVSGNLRLDVPINSGQSSQGGYPGGGAYPSRDGGIGQGGIVPQGMLPGVAGLESLGGNPMMANGANMQSQQGGLSGLYGGANPQQTIANQNPTQQSPSMVPNQQTNQPTSMAHGGAVPGQYNLGSYSDGGRLLKGPGDGVSDSIPAIIGQKQPARLATGEFVIPARIVSELGNGSTEAGAKRLYEMMNRIQQTRRKTKNVAANTNAAKYLPA